MAALACAVASGRDGRVVNMGLAELSPWLAAAIAFAVSWAVVRWLIQFLRAKQMMDVPNERSSHKVPTPRGGGLGIVAGIAAGWAVLALLGAPLPHVTVLAGAAVIALLGYLDDRMDMSAGTRFLVQILAAALVAVPVGGLPQLPFPAPLNVPLGPLAIPVAILWMVGVVNIYNFLDGIDGHAGLQGLIAGAGFAVLWWGSATGNTGLVVALAAAGFLLHNWHPARIFMGDVGSTTLGFLFAALPVQLEPEVRAEAVFVAAMLLWFFLADGLYTLVRRAWKRENVLKPHRTHLYQRWHQSGLRHDQVVLRVGVAAVALAASTILALRSGSAAWLWMAGLQALATFAAYAFLAQRDYTRHTRELATGVAR